MGRIPASRRRVTRRAKWTSWARSADRDEKRVTLANDKHKKGSIGKLDFNAPNHGTL
jgi:hypothetical protein